MRLYSIQSRVSVETHRMGGECAQCTQYYFVPTSSQVRRGRRARIVYSMRIGDKRSMGNVYVRDEE